MIKPLIINWCGIPKSFILKKNGKLNTFRIDEVKESGINVMLMEDYGVEVNKQVLKYCTKIKLRCIVHDKRINVAINDSTNRYNLLNEVINDYSSFSSLESYYLADEPSSTLFDSLADVSSYIQSKDKNHDCYINIFPNFANLDLLKTKTYEEYVREYLRKIKPKYLCYDHYHFLKKIYEKKNLGVVDEREQTIINDVFENDFRPGFFANLEQIVKICKEFNTPFMMCVLVTEHGPYQNVTLSQLKYETYQLLAYNSIGLLYFTYWCPGINGSDSDSIWKWNHAMITKKGKKTSHYFMCKKISRLFIKMRNVLSQYQYLKTLHIGKCDENGMEKYNLINPIKSASYDLTIGVFSNNVYLLANKDCKKTNDVIFNSKVSVYDFKKTCFVSINGVVSIKPGDAILIIENN